MVHVWRASLCVDADQHRHFEQTLSADEHSRASRFHFGHHRNEFVASRGILRAILGRYLAIAPALLRFSYTCACDAKRCSVSQRKPSLAGEHGLRFNVSHSHGIALYAVARDREVGVDVERICPSAAPDIVADWLSTSEAEAVQHLPMSLRTEASFRCWTRKEAVLKAAGIGLGISPRELNVLSSTRATLGRGERQRSWTWRDVHLDDGYAAAVAAEASAWRMTCWDWPPLLH